MSENIQPTSEENKIVENLKKENLSKNILTPVDEQLLNTKQRSTDKRRFGILVIIFFICIY